MAKQKTAIREALEEFAGTIDATGGVIQERSGLCSPAADRGWVDLGEAYLKACAALRRTPKWTEPEENC